MSTTKFSDGSSIEYNEAGDAVGFAGKTAVNLFALATAKSFLELEIKTNLAMKMSRHGSALNLAENLSGLNFGRGIKGRQKALVWVEAEMEKAKADTV